MIDDTTFGSISKYIFQGIKTAVNSVSRNVGKRTKARIDSNGPLGHIMGADMLMHLAKLIIKS